MLRKRLDLALHGTHPIVLVLTLHHLLICRRDLTIISGAEAVMIVETSFVDGKFRLSSAQVRKLLLEANNRLFLAHRPH